MFDGRRHLGLVPRNYNDERALLAFSALGGLPAPRSAFPASVSYAYPGPAYPSHHGHGHGGGQAQTNWRELYLEFHRGTYTSHGSIKKGNRHSEILLCVVEHVATLASLTGKKKYVYPKQALDDAWEKVLLNQLHGVLMRHSGMVYDDAEKLYEEVCEVGEKVFDDALDVILGGHARAPGVGSATELDQLPARRIQHDVLPPLRSRAGASPRRRGQRAPDTDRAAGGRWEDWVCGRAFCGWRAAVGAGGTASHGAVGFTPVSAHYLPRKGYEPAGRAARIRHPRLLLPSSRTDDVHLLGRRELIQEGAAGCLVISEDRPNYWDAWDVEIHHLEKPTQLELAKMSVVAQGPLRASVRAEVVYGQSRINVTISLDAVPASTKLDSRSMFRFDAWVDWRQRHEFLKFYVVLILSCVRGVRPQPRAFYTALRKNEAYAQLSSSPRFFHVFAEFVSAIYCKTSHTSLPRRCRAITGPTLFSNFLAAWTLPAVSQETPNAPSSRTSPKDSHINGSCSTQESKALSIFNYLLQIV
ncbi:hypothetical protein DFH08DRAFT_935053 [Mycena albidolilacea]|uniref:Glycoside hydrolase family 38 central domain-containing protein n=1 Tax=Mycena albidolilacea TaxID=1033008 RepID=A0AAD7ETP3_9AGAR|nr:hypothetical protein DFH08DRAFT_935053 [Mycena albidolilacea]